MGPPAVSSGGGSSSSTTTTTTTTNSATTKATLATTTTPSGSNNAARSLKKSADSDLKSSIIEFMKERPFLWNKRHSGYKDHKRRDQEFQQFSAEIGFSVQEIKRVWHVLRTNFFRAHKLLSDKPSSGGGGGSAAETGTGEKLWKYYLAMEYILEGSNLVVPTIVARSASQTSRGGGGSSSSSGASSGQEQQQQPPPPPNDGGGGGASGRDFRRSSNRSAASSASSARDTVNGFNGHSGKTPLSNGTSVCSADNSAATTPSKLSIFNDSALDEDDDLLYARYLRSTLRKFDPTTKEKVKLKFQEIIVDYMQQQQQQAQQQQQQQQQLLQLQQLSQLQPPPPSEIASLSDSLVAKKEARKQSSDDEIT